ncbi:pyridine nucleotide-disulfide oxidoreductase-domain-containing protein [Pholiota molesta]|nr:pyridine nucleotide-disulfide oxidoreductase-domain-containing protein [Pholiota molesta]
MSLMNIHARVAHGGLKHAGQALISPARHFSSSSSRSSGWGGYNVLRGVNKRDYDVVVISPNTYFNFTPLLASTAVGTLEFRCAIEPMPATRPLESEPTGDADTIQAQTTFPLHFDKLIIAVGAYSQTFGVPGVKEHAHFLKDVKDARKIRGRVLECFEQANQPSISDIDARTSLTSALLDARLIFSKGGGPTGIEFSAELHDLIHTDVARRYPALARLCKITIYDVAPQILGSFDQSLRSYTEKTMSREGIRILTNHHVERVEKRKMIVKETGEVPFGLLVWSTGLSPNPVVKDTTDVKKDPKSFLTDHHLNIIMDNGKPNPDVWAIGDAAQVMDEPLPATAQVAVQKASYVVKKVNKQIKDRDSPEPFAFQSRGSLAYIGNCPADEGFLKKETGRMAWILWRSAYFTMTLSTRNRILIPTYW